jgi:putative ABC transport system permease protein
MALVASYLALNVTNKIDKHLFFHALVGILIGGGGVLFVVTQGVLGIHPWYNPQYLIPLAGMIFSSSMTAISLALERLEAELVRQNPSSAFDIAFKAAMIPIVNSMMAVGVVSLPGMMTGQILSGIEPYIAARYQIMVMCMIFSATGLSVYLFLYLRANKNDGTKIDHF